MTFQGIRHGRSALCIVRPISFPFGRRALRTPCAQHVLREVGTGGEWGRIATRHEAEIATLKIELALLRGEMNNVRAERTDLILRVSALTAALDRERETSAALRGEVDTLKKRVRELERAP